MTFDDAATQLLSDPDNSFGTSATEAEIGSAARSLRVPISGGYQRFLQRFGWGGVPGYDLWGIGHGVPKRFDLVALTKSERMEMCPQLPEYLLPIMNDGGGNLVCLDTAASPDEPPVVMWYHDDLNGSDQVPEPVAANFVSWLERMLQERASMR